MIRKTTILLTVAALTAASQTTTPQKPGVPGVQFPIGAFIPDAQYAIGGGPDWLAVGEDMVWTNARQQNFVARMNPDTGDVVARVNVPKPCSGLIVGANSLWAPSCGDNMLYRIDLTTNKVVAKIAAPPANTEGGIAFGAGSVWVPSDPKGVVKRIDPANNSMVDIHVAPGSFTAIYGFGLVWVSSTEKNVVSVIHPSSNKVIAEIPVDAAPRFMAVGEGFVWTLNQTRGTVSKIDPYLKKTIATIEVGVPGLGGEIAAGEGSVWVTAPTIPVSRIDPVQNKVVQQFVGPGGDGIEVGHGSVWLSNFSAAAVWRVQPSKLDTVAATTWISRALPADLDGDKQADILVEDVMVRFIGEPLRFRIKVLNPNVGQSFALKTTLADKEAMTDFVKQGDEWVATFVPGPERGYVRYTVCVKGTAKCSEENGVGTPTAPLPYAKGQKKFVPADFLLPVFPKIGEYVWVIHDGVTNEVDYNALHNRPVPMKIAMSEDYGGLKRHEWEFVNNMAYSFGIFTADHTEELGFLYITPSPKAGYDASVRFEVTTAGEKVGLEPVMDKAIHEWVKSSWPFKQPAYPGHDIPLEKWNALPNAE